MYKRFPSLKDAQAAITQVNFRHAQGDNYADPIPHPCLVDALVKYRPELLTVCNDIFEKYPVLSAEEAVQAGWYLGPFPGRLGKSRAKLEEAQHLFDALANPLIASNRPVFRTLFFAYLSTFYSLRESMKKVCPAFPGALNDWWRQRLAEIDARGELLEYLNRIGNRDKHNHENYFKYPAMIYNISTPRELPPGWPSGQYRVQISGEGTFALFDEGKKTFRRIPLGLGEGIYNIELIGTPNLHLGNPIDNCSVLSLCRMAREYYENILFEAEELERQQ